MGLGQRSIIKERGFWDCSGFLVADALFLVRWEVSLF